MTVTRRQGREWALQMLCMVELNPPDNLDDAINAFWHQQLQLLNDAPHDADIFPEAFTARPAGKINPAETNEVLTDELASVAPEMIRTFAETRVRGVLSERDAIDHDLEPHLDHWLLYRLGTVERNILRLGAWELAHCQDIPGPVIINEAVDIAKFFSESKSGRFVNGVLDGLARKLNRRERPTKRIRAKPAVKKVSEQ